MFAFGYSTWVPKSLLTMDSNSLKGSADFKNKVFLN